MNIDLQRLKKALHKATGALLDERNDAGHWEGELSSSALSTATAVVALAVWEQGADPHGLPAELFTANARAARRDAIRSGLRWLVENQNEDGGWGDTTLSFSNISTTALGWAAFGAVPGADEEFSDSVERAAEWLQRKAGGLKPERLAHAITARYGKDRTFSVPILTMCTIGGRLGEDGWKHVIQLPFELAAFPQELFAAMRLPVVSYALPALIAIGQVRHAKLPTRNPFARGFRNLTRSRTLEVLKNIQPESGGFLEATPLTSFVTMSLAAAGNADHPVALQAIRFLMDSLRADGSWPIDTNLATWVTTMSLDALSKGGGLDLSKDEQACVRDWLLGQHYQVVHPYTNAAPGGWAWTDLTGGVPDADDTPGALVALNRLGAEESRVNESGAMGVKWLLDLQNSDGGIPTFCRGWTNLPFDRSSPDLTAHTLRAWCCWRDSLAEELVRKTEQAMDDALTYLTGTQRNDGAWVPLWFGNQHSTDDENPTYGTAKVLTALNDIVEYNSIRITSPAKGAADWLIHAQKPDGSWSGGGDWPASIEETALALEALAGCPFQLDGLENAIDTGTRWLIKKVEADEWTNASPIGFYFAKLWYYEKLYPMIYTVGALNRVGSRIEKTKISREP